MEPAPVSKGPGALHVQVLRLLEDSTKAFHPRGRAGARGPQLRSRSPACSSPVRAASDWGRLGHVWGD